MNNTTVRLLRAKIIGVKNLENEVFLKFSPDTLQRSIEGNNYNVKAIYGENGVGKSAIIEAFQLYKKLLTSKDFVTISNNDNYFSKIINQKTEKCRLEFTFAVVEDYKIRSVYQHVISIEKNDSKFVLTEEKLSTLTGLSLNKEDKYKTIYHVINGEISNVSPKILDRKTAKNLTANLLDTKLFLPLIIRYCLDEFIKTSSKSTSILPIQCYSDIHLTFCKNIKIVLHDEAICNSNTNLYSIDEINNTLKNFNDILQQKDTDIEKIDIYEKVVNNLSSNKQGNMIVEKENAEIVRMKYKKVEKFLKIFLYGLDEIILKEINHDDLVEFSVLFKYKNSTVVPAYLESTGTRKLVVLYDAFQKVNDGGIVLIDELDSSINNVLLSKILEYISTYTEGQLIFTTHSLSPMEVLQNNKLSIDFLVFDNSIVSWVKKGNKSASSTYMKGHIEKTPFNIFSADFASVFENE